MSFPIPHKTAEISRNIGILDDHNTIPNSNQIQDLQSALLEDAQSYLYNGIVSFGSAINSINAENYGWAIVKFYYSVFYLARSKLATNQITIVYDGKTPYILSLPSSPILTKQTGKNASSTHKLVLKLLIDHFPSNSFYCIGSDNTPIINWLMRQREIANYTSAMMPDPEPPKILKQIVENSTINKWLETYKQEPTLYVVDEDHTCLAYPFLFLLEVLNEFETKRYSCNHLKDNLNFIKNLLREKKGKNLDTILSIIRRI